MKIAFFGTPEFAVPSLRALVSRHTVVCVVTQPDRPSGRGRTVEFSPVKAYAIENNIPVFQPENVSKQLDEIFGANGAAEIPDIIVTCAYGQILRANVLELCRYGVINVHASLLPKYRGSSPIQWAIINGETRTGVTIMHTDVGLDTGDMILTRECSIDPAETAGELTARLSEIGAGALLTALDEIAGGTATRVSQNNAEATKFPMLKKTDGRIDFGKTPAEIVNLVRGLHPWPVAYFASNIGDIRVHRASVADGRLQFDIVQMAGGKRLSWRDFTNGRRVVISGIPAGYPFGGVK